MNRTVKFAAQKLLGPRYDDVRESLSHTRLAEVETRVADLEARLRHDIGAQLARQMYGQGAAERRTLEQHELQVYSQNGEDGILLWLLSHSGCPNRRLAEIGVGDGSECNSANLLINWGWTGVLVEGDSAGAAAAGDLHDARPEVIVRNAFATVENVNGLLPDQAIDMLSIDIDGNDYWVWEAIEADPLVVVIEYNASLGPSRSLTIPYDPDFDYTVASDHRLYHGASLTALTRLGARKGMVLVGCDSRGVNAFFVREEFTGERLRRVQPSEAWRPIRKRLRRWSQDAQEEMLRGFDFVEIEP